MRIRSAVETDIPQLLRLIEALTADEGHAGMSTMTAPVLRHQLFRCAPPVFSCIVAEDDLAALAGFACYWTMPSGPNSAPTMRVMGLFVSPARRRLRIGERLMRAVARHAIEQACGAISWWTSASAPGSRRFSAWLGAQAESSGAEYRLSAAAAHALATPPTDSMLG